MTNLLPAAQAAPMREVNQSQRQQHIKPITAPLHVVVGLSNPMRFASRYRLFEAFRKHVEDSGALLTTVELALGDRHFEVTSPHNPRDVQLRSHSVLWHKESALNVAIRHLALTDPDWQYVAFVDSDITFSRPDWAVETVHLLQSYGWIQMWSHAIDMGPYGQPIGYQTSIMHDRLNADRVLEPIAVAGGSDAYGYGGPSNKPKKPQPVGAIGTPMPLHPGYAHALRRDTFDALGGLGDIGILGSGDHHMLYALLGEVERSLPGGLPQSYPDYWHRWQDRAQRTVRRNLGVMQGSILHHFHGRKADRRYITRWDILRKWQFDYLRDIQHGASGVWEWSHDTAPGFVQDVRAYFALRNEDSVEWP